MIERYYKILELQFPSTRDEVKRAYRRLAHIYHPDKGGDENKFKELSEAYHVVVQNGYWDVLAKEQARGEAMTKQYASSTSIFCSDDGTEFWTEDFAGFVTYYWTADCERIDAMIFRREDMSSRTKEYADASPLRLKR